MYEVYISKRVPKNFRHMPIPVQRKMINLIDDLRDKGPIKPEWPNFGKLVSDHYQLGQMLGGFSRRHISHLERDIRPVPSDLAQKLSRLFDASIEKFTQ